jgi:acetyl-CoA acyltransferase
MNNCVIVDGVRTAIGNHCGSLSTVRADDMAAIVIKELVKRNPSVPLDQIADVFLGCANQAGDDNRNIARMSSLLAGLPVEVPGETVNRLCASGMSAVVNADRAIKASNLDFIIAGGVESMTRAPYVISKTSTPFGRNAEMFDTSIGWRFVNPKMKEAYGTDSMGETAENVALEYKITREAQDNFAVNSQLKASKAQKENRFHSEIVGVEIQKSKSEVAVFNQDEFIRSNTTNETLAKLKPAFKKDGTVTAGNSSGINDGACVLLLASENSAKNAKLKPRARIIASAVAGVAPRVMGIGPVPATQKVLQSAGLTLKDISVIELNEAFAAQSLGCLQLLGIAADDSRVNPNGGAIALGHPLGMSGARLILTALHELELRSERYALCTMCIGVGQGMAVIIERING